MHVADSVELLLGHVDEIAVAPNACVFYNDIESPEDFAGLIGLAPGGAAIRDIVGANNYLATKRPSFSADFVHPTWRRRRCRRSRCRNRARAPSAFSGYEQRVLTSNTALVPVVMTTRPSSVVIIGT